MVGDKVEVMVAGGETETEVLIVTDFCYTFTCENEYVLFLHTWDYGPASLLSPFQAVYIFDPMARSSSEVLSSVYDGDRITRITLIYEDLKSIAELGR